MGHKIIKECERCLDIFLIHVCEFVDRNRNVCSEIQFIGLVSTICPLVTISTVAFMSAFLSFLFWLFSFPDPEDAVPGFIVNT